MMLIYKAGLYRERGHLYIEKDDRLRNRMDTITIDNMRQSGWSI